MGACCSSQTAAQVAEPSKPIAAQKSETDFRNTRSVSKIRESVEEKLDDARYEDVDVLITIPFFDDLDKKHLKDLRQLFSREKYEKDQVICEEGKNHNMFYVIVNGSARLTTRTADGEFELAVLGKGNWFGEIALMDDSLQAVTARAMEKTTILSMTMQQYQDAVKRHPDLSVSISTFGNIPPLKVQLKTIPFFATVPDRKLQLLAALVEIRKCQPAEVLCRQGEDADGFYYIIEGRANVSASGHDGQQVHLDSLGPGMWFGEIALMENTQRTATVTSQQACSLLYLSRERFNRFLKLAPEIIETGVLQRLITKRTANSLKAIPLFQEFRTKELGPLEKFDENKLHLLGELFKFVQFQAGQKIFSEGDVADAFYIIVSGTLDVMASDPSGKVLKLAELNQSDWFGELALVQEGGKRNSTVVAVVPTLLLRLGRENFHKFMQLTPGIESLLRARIDVRTADRLAKIPFFSGIRENRPWSKLDLLGGLFRFEEYPAGHVVFQEGEKGDKFYVIVEGSVSVSVTRPEKGDVVIDKLKKDMWFGEIALLQRTPRTASITCDEQCVFITLAADQFQLFLCVAPELSEPFSALVSHRTANVLRTLDLFRNVRENKPWSKLELLGTLFTYEQRPAGETVIKFGEPATTFFLIIRGKVNISGRTDDGKDEDLGFASAQQHFGEVALLRNRPHNTTVVTVEPCMFLCLTKRAFQQFMKVAPELKPYFQEIVHNRRQSVSTSFLVESDSIELDFPREDSSGTISRSDSLDQKIAVLEARAARSAAQEQRAHDALVDSVPEDPEEKEEPAAKEETPAKEADAAKPDGSDEKTSDQI